MSRNSRNTKQDRNLNKKLREIESNYSYDTNLDIEDFEDFETEAPMHANTKAYWDEWDN